MHRRSIPLSLVVTVAIALAALASPAATSACSCAMPGPMADVRGDPEIAVFSGVVDPQDARGYPVTITRWFQGGGIVEPRIWFTAASFSGDGASCGIAPLPVATEWIFVAYRVEGMYGTGLCSPHAALASAEGQAMLADAARTFGAGGPVGPDPSSAPSPAAPSPDPSPPASPDGAAIFIETMGPLVLVVVFGLGILLGVVGALRRTRLGRD